MKFSVVTIFPDMIRDYLRYGLLEKAIQKQRLTVAVYDLRDFAANKHQKVDDRPFGGGAGMVLMPGPLFTAVEGIREREPGRVILFSAYGRVLEQKTLLRLARDPHLILVCGRYEGVDQRFIDTLVDEEISLGRYVLMGGEIAAEALIEGVARLVPGVIANPDSVESDSFFQEDQMAFPQYTQPRLFRDLPIPDVLLSGDHEKIRAWREKMQKRSKKHE